MSRFYDLLVIPEGGHGWRSAWLNGDHETQILLYRDFVFSGRYDAVKLVLVTPPPDYAPREVLEYWEKKK